MCFIKHLCYRGVSSKDVLALEKHVAEQDITVYKIIRKVNRKFSFFVPSYYRSLVRGFNYRLYHTYKTKLKVVCINVDTVNYSHFLQGSEGFHSYKNMPSKQLDSCVVAEFIIPKGAFYYENSNTYISDKIIFNKVIKYVNNRRKTILC